MPAHLRLRPLLPCRLSLGALLLGLAACQARLDQPIRESVPSARRIETAQDVGRLPRFAGGQPEKRGWAQVRGLFWVRAKEVETWSSGQVYDGTRWWPVEEAPAHERPAPDGYLLRTSHVSLRTDVPWAEAERIAREAQRHVERTFETYGEVLDLRFPSRPLRVVVHRRRDDYHRALSEVMPGHYGWAAFYDSETGTVHVSTEQAPRGALPFRADLRHEMTHQILDLSRERRLRGAPRTHVWLWEGIAVHNETLGDGPGDDTGRLRRERFQRRRARDEVTPLGELLRLDAGRLEGRHYDQIGVLMTFLMEDGVPGSRQAVLETLALVLRGVEGPSEFLRRLRVDAKEVERAWLEG